MDEPADLQLKRENTKKMFDVGEISLSLLYFKSAGNAVVFFIVVTVFWLLGEWTDEGIRNVQLLTYLVVAIVVHYFFLWAIGDVRGMKSLLTSVIKLRDGTRFVFKLVGDILLLCFSIAFLLYACTCAHEFLSRHQEIYAENSRRHREIIEKLREISGNH